MPVEIIGEFGTPGAHSEWLEAEGKLAIRHLMKVCGEPPSEMELQIVWQEHELGSYPVIALVWEDTMRGTPWNYLSECEAALAAYEDGEKSLPTGDSAPAAPELDDDTPFDPDRPPPESPDTLDVLNAQRYIDKLITWAFAASALERTRPHLVEDTDEDESDSTS